MKIIDNPPKDKKFLAVYIDGDDQQAMVCKWDGELESFLYEKDTFNGWQWWPVKFHQWFKFIVEE